MALTIDKTTPSMLHLLTEREACILDAAAHVKFGELTDVTIEHVEPKLSKSLTPTQLAFITSVRDEGLTFMDTVVVHNGTPSQIEIDGTFQTIKYKRKIRFN